MAATQPKLTNLLEIHIPPGMLNKELWISNAALCVHNVTKFLLTDS